MVIPGIVVVLYLCALFTEDIWQTQYGTWLLLSTFISISTAIWFYLLGFGILFQLKEQLDGNLELDRKEKEYLDFIVKEKKTEKEEQAEKDTNKQSLLQPEKPEKPEEPQPHRAYTERQRSIGYGPLRIGTFFELTEDIYSLLFVAFVREEYEEALDSESDDENAAFDDD